MQIEPILSEILDGTAGGAESPFRLRPPDFKTFLTSNF